MRDIGHDETEILLKQMEKRIAFEYMQAEKEIAAKLDDYLNKFKIKDELKQKALANGLITEQEYQQWRIGQIMMGKRWEEMRDALAKDFTNADKIAKSIAYGYQPDVYAINHDYGTFQVEKASRMDTSYTLYDRDTVAELMKNEDFIPAPGRKISAMINENKDLAWNKKQVQSVMMQGIIQGESISKMATRLAETVGDADRKAAIRNARTMTTGVENAGRMASYDRANDMGIKTQKQWLATLDFRTRHWHADLDGVAVNNDEPFHNEYGDIMYPGDPKADPANIYNCRCTMIASVKGFERDVSNTDLRHDDNLKGMSYKEWKEKHYKMESHSITKQDEIAEHMRNVYGAEYRKYSQLPDVESMEPEKPPKEELHGDLKSYEHVRGRCESSNVAHKTVEDLPTRLTEDEIINKLAGGDQTQGSCASLALAYCGNKAGLDITDFRGGDSRAIFSRGGWRDAIKTSNAVFTGEYVTKEAAGVAKIIKTLDKDKEYMLICGKHAAIIKNTDVGLQYLEMQSPSKNGWQPFESVKNYTFMGKEWTEKNTVADTLQKRFGCRKTVGGLCELAEVDTFKDTVEFRDIMGYINTNTGEQKKGMGGGIK